MVVDNNRQCQQEENEKQSNHGSEFHCKAFGIENDYKLK